MSETHHGQPSQNGPASSIGYRTEGRNKAADHRSFNDWPPETIASLRVLWADPAIGTAEIGRRLGVSKNAAVGKAHRLGLRRPSPIKQRDPGLPPAPDRRLAPLPPGAARFPRCRASSPGVDRERHGRT